MNILFLFYDPIVPHIGGIQRVTENLAIEMKARGHSVYYLSTNLSEDLFNYSFPIPQLRIGFTENQEQGKHEFVSILQQYLIDLIINQEAREDLLQLLAVAPRNIKKITCVHIQPFLAQGYSKELIRYYNLPGWKAKLYKAYCTVNNSYYRSGMIKTERAMLSKALYVSDYLCFLSERFIPRVLKYMPTVDSNKLIAVNNPCSFTSTSIDCCNKKKQILWVARHSNAPKNFPSFVDFWKVFHLLHPDWEAIVLGAGRDLVFNKEYARKKKVKNIRFIGNQENVSTFYQEATFVCMTSIYEGWGMILTEAMNYGCIPCAFDTYESLHDIIDDGVNGLIIPPFKVDVMSNRLSNLLNDTSLLSAMRNACVEKAKIFSVDRIVDKWEIIINKL